MNNEPALSLCREIWPSFESGHLGVHFTWSRKHRVPLTYILLRENPIEVLVQSWLTTSFEDRESALISRRYGLHGSFILVLYWNWCSSRIEMGGLTESLDFRKGCQVTCIWCGTWDGDGANAGQMRFILSWFAVHQSILHCWGDISVLLLLWQCSWGFSVVPSGKLRFLTCLIGNTELLFTECRGIGPHLEVIGNSHESSQVVAGTWGIFSNYSGDGHFEIRVCSWSLDTCLFRMYTSGI